MIQPLFLGLGTTEIIVILVVVLLLFGGKKIPELMRGAGKGQHPHVSALRGEHFAGAQETKKGERSPVVPLTLLCLLSTNYLVPGLLRETETPCMVSPSIVAVPLVIEA